LSLLQLFIALGTGGANSLLVLYVLLPGLFLYHVLRSTKGLNVIAQGIARLAPDPNLQVLMLVLGVAPFVESVSGFGLGIVVVIPILAALELQPLQAAMLGMLSQVNVPWGALAVGTALGAQLTGLPTTLLGADTALLMVPVPIIMGFMALLLRGGKNALRRWWPVALGASLILSLGEYGFSLLPGPELAGVLASALSLGFLAGLSTYLGHRHHVVPKGIFLTEDQTSQTTPAQSLSLEGKYTWFPSFRLAITPYAMLTCFLLISRLVLPLRIWLQANGVVNVPIIHLDFALLFEPGFWILLTTLLTIPLLGLSGIAVQQALFDAWKQFVPGAITILCFLTAAEIMRASGMTLTLGTAAAKLGNGYVWFVPWIGALGGWLTGSNTGGNALFAQLQQVTGAKAGLSTLWVIAAQNGAGSLATMISPARITLAATAANVPNKEGMLLRKIGPLALIVIVLSMLALVLLAGRRG
jgi:lactate permease